MSDVLRSDEGGKGKRGEKKRKEPWLSLNGRWPALNVRSETNSILLLRLGLMNWQTPLGACDGAPARGDGRLWQQSYPGGGGGLNSRLSLSAELAIELFCLAHIVCHGGAGEKCLVPPVGRNSVSTSKIRGCVWNIVESLRVWSVFVSLSPPHSSGFQYHRSEP